MQDGLLLFLEMKENKEMISTIDLGMEEYNLALEKIHNK